MMALLIQWGLCFPTPLYSGVDSSQGSSVKFTICYSSSLLWTHTDVVSVGHGYGRACVVCLIRMLCMLQNHLICGLCTHQQYVCACACMCAPVCACVYTNAQRTSFVAAYLLFAQIHACTHSKV